MARLWICVILVFVFGVCGCGKKKAAESPESEIKSLQHYQQQAQEQIDKSNALKELEKLESEIEADIRQEEAAK